ncbi:hypothetical protein [Brevundimonas lenta]|uniref:Uncharacterized protein n=1 Tax=Brevundimonas lenta TaxID=424796 RepID=A0A7W6NPH1_9CAUL|nr:hypothetical protein [Brevundimonas lenta]MBB4083415.1 hypothetical protein [Brevundimonas lenta]
MLVILAAFAIGLASPQDTTTPQTPAPTGDASTTTVLPPVTATGTRNGEEDPNRMVCRRSAATVGSNRPRRVCATAAQWEEARQETREALRRDSQGQNLGGASTTGGEGPPGRGF